MNKNFVIIHYNTPLLTECLVRSINLFVSGATIYVFDNSDKFPFTAKFDNVIILDNTSGKIINFDKWLEKYPRRVKSPGRVNRWASAKHCYSVEKCIDLLQESFILLDSDILFKKDVSELFRDDVIYCGESITQPRSDIKRVAPFLCYINVDMCKKYGVHYFDDNYMHGLSHLTYNKNSDKYDTGGGFYLHAVKYPHIDIKLDDYIVHYGHGSWNKEGEDPKESAVGWLKNNREYWSSQMNKNVIYTCISGNYDSLTEPMHISEGFDYICFTDNKEIKSDVWEIRPLPLETEGLSQIKKQRYVKINAHKYLSEYDISVWVDGNVLIKGDLNELLDEILEDEYSVYVPTHPTRCCIYDESVAVVKMKKDTSENVDPQIKRYREEGYPEKYGLLQSNILIRKHNNEDCIKLMEDWFEEIKDGSHRDQLSFNYVSWKNPSIKVKYLDKKIYRSKWFNWDGKHIKLKKKIDESKEEKQISHKEQFKELIKNSRKRVNTNDIKLY